MMTAQVMAMTKQNMTKQQLAAITQRMKLYIGSRKRVATNVVKAMRAIAKPYAHTHHDALPAITDIDMFWCDLMSIQQSGAKYDTVAMATLNQWAYSTMKGANPDGSSVTDRESVATFIDECLETSTSDLLPNDLLFTVYTETHPENPMGKQTFMTHLKDIMYQHRSRYGWEYTAKLKSWSKMSLKDPWICANNKQDWIKEHPAQGYRGLVRIDQKE